MNVMTSEEGKFVLFGGAGTTATGSSSLIGLNDVWTYNVDNPQCTATLFETPLNVETWILGSGGRMSSICGANNTFLEYNIYQVDDVKMPSGTNWSNTADHSKWANAVSRGSNANQQSYSSPHGMLATCVGDTNRMCSQENRGGGALCTEENYYLWLAFNSVRLIIDLINYLFFS